MGTKQITIRLPEDLVAFVDEQIGAHPELSRAAVVTQALSRERRRLIAERDADIYADWQGREDPDDLGGLARWGVGEAMDLD